MTRKWRRGNPSCARHIVQVQNDVVPFVVFVLLAKLQWSGKSVIKLCDPCLFCVFDMWEQFSMKRGNVAVYPLFVSKAVCRFYSAAVCSHMFVRGQWDEERR